MTQWQPDNQPRHRAGQPPATPPQWGAPPPHGPPQPQWVPLEQRGNYGQPQPGWQPPRYQPPGPPPRKKHTGLKVTAGIGGGLLAVIVIAAVASSGKPAATTPAAPGHAAASPSHSTVAAKAVTVATFHGSGAQTTPPFTVAATWKLSYSFDCSNFGYKGNFQVYEEGSDGAMKNILANDLAMSKTGSSWAYGDAGTRHLNVNSECDWTVKVTDEGS